MAEYYFISQLPSLDGLAENVPLPITQERFLELSEQHLKKKTAEELKKLTLVPHKNTEKSVSPLLDRWNEEEKNLRLVLGRLRADKMNKSFPEENPTASPYILQTAKAATETESPLEAEKLLNRFRLDLLEQLRPLDSFSEDYAFYYLLKLKLISRIRQFDTLTGEQEYKNIYNSIISKDRTEDTP